MKHVGGEQSSSDHARQQVPSLASAIPVPQLACGIPTDAVRSCLTFPKQMNEQRGCDKLGKPFFPDYRALFLSSDLVGQKRGTVLGNLT